DRTYPDGLMRRAAHPKHHGCLRGELAVPDDLEARYAVGLFQPGRRYAAWVRLSNNEKPQPDGIADTRGLAIKLLDVPGRKVADTEPGAPTHDFLLATNPRFLARNAEDYLGVLKAVKTGGALKYFFNPLDPHLRTLMIARELQAQHADMLDIRYWSMVPYRFGDSRAVKYSARPCAPRGSRMPEAPDDDFLHQRLVQAMNSGGACYEFMVQLQTDPATMPVEDPTIAWDETDSPFVAIARLELPAQQFDSEEQMTFCENLSFNPWRALPEHRPLGGISRARRAIYNAMSGYRHARNDSPASELRAGAYY
ncbi:MAG: catalase family protein, partial [Gammaproteobacteria bacterium]|nr:catalase family protein [Gammaproteobacteria bacterium]